MDYTKALRQRDKLENELKGIDWKVKNSNTIRINMQSWYYKKLEDYKVFLGENKLSPVSIDINEKPDI